MVTLTSERSAEITVTDEDINAAFRLADTLERAGRIDDLRLLLKLIGQIEAMRAPQISRQDPTSEELEALDREDAEMAADKVVPHEVVVQGREAVAAYVRRRDAGELDPETAAAVEAYRRDYEARRQTTIRRGDPSLRSG
jgi:hypothetical protein